MMPAVNVIFNAMVTYIQAMDVSVCLLAPSSTEDAVTNTNHISNTQLFLAICIV